MKHEHRHRPALALSGGGPLVEALLACGHRLVPREEAELVVDPTEPVGPGQVALTTRGPLSVLDGLAGELAISMIEVDETCLLADASNEAAKAVAKVMAEELERPLAWLPGERFEAFCAAVAVTRQRSAVAQQVDRGIDALFDHDEDLSVAVFLAAKNPECRLPKPQAPERFFDAASRKAVMALQQVSRELDV